MAISTRDIELMPQLMRRTGSGVSREEGEAHAAKSYEATVAEVGMGVMPRLGVY